MPRVLPSWALSQRVGSFVSRGGSLVSARAGEATRIAAAQAVQTDPLAALRRSAAASLALRALLGADRFCCWSPLLLLAILTTLAGKVISCVRKVSRLLAGDASKAPGARCSW